MAEDIEEKKDVGENLEADEVVHLAKIFDILAFAEKQLQINKDVNDKQQLIGKN